jgi:Methyltransferase domain
MTDVAAPLAFLQDLPTLHHWGGRPQVGGLDRRIGRRIVDELEPLEHPAVLETGAGASTLLFLLLDVGQLTSVAPDEALHARVLAEAAARGISTDALRFVVDRSEWALPAMAAAGEHVDVALIDGNHGWPAVFVDFCYVNVMLRRDGILFLDDVQLHSVSQLYLLLRNQPEYERIALDGKLATFRKVSDEPFLPDWAAQPFIRASSMR